MRQMRGEGVYCMTITSRPTTPTKQTPCHQPTSRPQRGSTKRYVDTVTTRRTESGIKCGGIVGHVFDSEGLLGGDSVWSVHMTGEGNVRSIPTCEQDFVLCKPSLNLAKWKWPPWRKLTSKAVGKIQDTIAGRQDSPHAHRLAKTRGTSGKGVELASRLRARVGDTFLSVSQQNAWHLTLNEF